MIITILIAIIAILQIGILVKLYTNKEVDVKNYLLKIDQQISHSEDAARKDFGRNREEMNSAFQNNKQDVQYSIKLLGEELLKIITLVNNNQKQQFTSFSEELKSFENQFEKAQNKFLYSIKENREEQSKSLKSFEINASKNINEINETQKVRLDNILSHQSILKSETENKLKEIRETIEIKLQHLQQDNNNKLEEMRKTVDEKLQSSVEKRFNESFKIISERLEQVHKGLGEMQNLASGVGDLKKVLTNVKTRGNLGEIQLGAILVQVLSPEQYIQNAVIQPHTSERVEFAIKLPGRSLQESVLLPIDSKFPNEDYQRLLEAYDHRENTIEFEIASRQFENAVKKNAKDIKEKYIIPPYSTDFAIMFVPTEGLYAEILRRTGLFEFLQRNFKITVVGPTNLVAFLSSLQMGFKTLAIEKRSSEVWEILGAVKTEFGNFGGILEKTKKKLLEATNVIDSAGIRTRAIERKLREVQELPIEKSEILLETTSIRNITNNSEEDSDK